MKKQSILPLLEEYFLNYLPNTKGVSNNTIRSYKFTFRLLIQFLSEQKNISPDKISFSLLTADMINEFLNYLESDRSCSVKTRNIRRAALASFAKYAANKDFSLSLPFYTAIMKTPKKKEPKKNSIKYFTQEEIGIILSEPIPNTQTGQRDIVLLSVLYASGARAQELCDIQVKDIQFTTPTRIKLTGKGNKTRIVTIPEKCTTLLKKYMSSNGMLSNDVNIQNRHLFSSRTHEHMSIACVEGIVKKYLDSARIKYPDKFKESRYTPHTFRHSIAVHMLEAGDSLVTIKAFLGHSSIMTTTIYAQVTPELANKYLDNRGKPLPDSINTEVQPVPTALSFLY